eukprot:5204028-Amphidinium_carterae.1
MQDIPPPLLFPAEPGVRGGEGCLSPYWAVRTDVPSNTPRTTMPCATACGPPFQFGAYPTPNPPISMGWGM